MMWQLAIAGQLNLEDGLTSIHLQLEEVEPVLFQCQMQLMSLEATLVKTLVKSSDMVVLFGKKVRTYQMV